MSTVDLYAVLGVARDASTDEIRTAWTAAVAGLGPTDPSFRVFNQAGEVLLDPARRQKYDAELESSEAAEPTTAPGAETGSDVRERPEEVGPTLPRSGVGVSAGRRPQGAPTWLLVALAALTLLAGGAAIFAADPIGRALPDRSAPAGTAELSDAVRAAESAVVPVLSYDYRHLDDDRDAAVARMTDDFAKDYRKTFALIEQNAPENKAVVQVEVLASALASASDDRVEVLLFVNRPTTNKTSAEAQVYRDQVTLKMVREGDEWLVDDMRTTLPS